MTALIWLPGMEPKRAPGMASASAAPEPLSSSSSPSRTSTGRSIAASSAGEVSTNVGGLLIWPAKGLILLGFVLLGLQWFSETVKRIAVMRGELRDDHLSASHHAAAEAEAERLLAAIEGDTKADIPSDAAAR